MNRGGITGVLLLVAALGAAALGNDYQIYILGVAATSALVGAGLNIMLGLTGQLSLGHAGFLALGAYLPTILASRLSIGYGSASLLGMLLTGLVGACLSIPALRVRGPYLAMVTIAFGFVVEQGIADWKDLTGGWNGLSGIGTPEPFGKPLSPRALTLLEVGLAFAAVPAFAWLRQSRLGLLMRATRNSEVAARSIGVDLVLVRALAFGLSAAITGLAGALLASSTSFISPESFPFFLSITFVLIVLIGGEGHPLGPILGSCIVVLLPELFSGLAEYRLLFFGVLLFVVLRLLPHGLAGLITASSRSAGGSEASANPGHPAAPADPADPADTADARDADSRAAVWLRPPLPSGLVCRALDKRFGGNRALEGVSINIPPGEITALIGPNGAGKTTFINLVCGFYSADGGSIDFGAAGLGPAAMHQRARAGIVRTFQTTQLFDDLSVLENVRAALTQGRITRREPVDGAGLARALLREVGYRGPVDIPAGALAHVDRRLVELARALAARPRVLLLDEPGAGLSRSEKVVLVKVLTDIAQHGIAVFLIEHDMRVVMSASSTVYVLDGGRPLAQGTPAAVADDARVKQAYLGTSDPVHTRRRRDQGAAGRVSVPQLLSIDGVAASYGAIGVIQGVSIQMCAGSVTAILGANGAGKSTLMKTLSGLLPHTAGAILFHGKSLAGTAAFERARRGLVLVPEGRQIFPDMSVVDNLRLGATARGGITAADLERLLARFPRLVPLRDRPAGLLSGGEQQMLALGRGIAAGPQLLLLDEPTLGLAPAVALELFAALEDLAQAGLSLLIADQMSHLVLPLADDIHIMSQGKITAHLPGAQGVDPDRLERAYFDRL